MDKQIQRSKSRNSFRNNSFIWSRTSQQNLQDLYRPQFDQYHKENEENEKLWNLMANYIPRTVETIQSQFVKHIEYTLAKTRFNFDRNTAYQAISYSVRDRLIESFNDTQQQLKLKDCKRINYLSLEFLIGRCLQNALINIDLEDKYKAALQDLGYDLEDLYEEETDAALGNGGLGRLAACFLDSLATLNYPAWGYGLRYNYGIFKQVLNNGHQIEVPDYWFDRGYPWEIERLDVTYPIKFYGYTERHFVNGVEQVNWVSGETVKAVAYDNPIPGYDTFNTISLRLWRSCPLQEFDFSSFNQNDYSQSIKQKQRAEVITSVLYPKDDTYEGKELRLKQEYLLCSASIQDIVRRFKQRKNYDWSDFPEKNSIQLNDTHPALAPIELLRIFIDIEKVEKKLAFDLIYKTFSYTNHTLLPEALERIGVDIMSNLLPRHMEIIYEINHQFLEKIQAKYPGNFHKFSSMSCIQEGDYKKVKMANIAIITSHTVNGVAALHSRLVKQDLFNDFYQHRPSKFQNKTNGVTPRRWIRAANPKLSEFYTKKLGSNEWLINMDLLRTLQKITEDPKARQEWREIKQQAKNKLVKWVKDNCGVVLNPNALFDIQVKRIHEYKRQLMNILQVVRRYLDIKQAQDKSQFIPKAFMYGGKAAPGYYNAKCIIKFINNVANVVNKDPEIGDLLKVVYFPNYKVSNAQIIIPASDISNHISTAGLEASGTSNMKFVMNGGIICGTLDGANVEILEEIGDDNMFVFGEVVENIEQQRQRMRTISSEEYLGPLLKEVIDEIRNGRFGDDIEIMNLMNTFTNKNDFYLVGLDFYGLYEIQKKIDATYKDKDKWTKMSICNAILSGKFSSDRTIHEYAEEIWNIQPQIIPKPAEDKKKVFKTSTSGADLSKLV